MKENSDDLKTLAERIIEKLNHEWEEADWLAEPNGNGGREIIGNPPIQLSIISFIRDTEESIENATDADVKDTAILARCRLFEALVAIDSGDIQGAASACLFAGGYLSELPGWSNASLKLRRTKTNVVFRIRELRKQGKETWEIPGILEREGLTKQKRNGKQKPWNEADVRSYMNRHGIP